MDEILKKSLIEDAISMRDKVYDSLVKKFGTENLFMEQMRIITEEEGKEKDTSSVYEISANDKFICSGYLIRKEDIGVYVDLGEENEIISYDDMILVYLKEEEITDDVISRITTEILPDKLSLSEITKLMCKEVFGDNKYALIEFKDYDGITKHIQIDIERLCKGKYQKAYFRVSVDSTQIHFCFKNEDILNITYDYNEKKFKFTFCNDRNDFKITLLCNSQDELKLFKTLNNINVI